MVDTNRLKGVIVQNGKTQGDVAERIGITPKTFYAKMKKGVFGLDEIEKIKRRGRSFARAAPGLARA